MYPGNSNRTNLNGDHENTGYSLSDQNSSNSIVVLLSYCIIRKRSFGRRLFLTRTRNRILLWQSAESAKRILVVVINKNKIWILKFADSADCHNKVIVSALLIRTQ